MIPTLLKSLSLGFAVASLSSACAVTVAYIYCGLALVAILLMGSCPVLVCVEEWLEKRREAK